VLLQEFDKVLELEQHVLLQNLDVRLGLAQAVEALQQELADLGRSLDTQALQLGLHILQRGRVRGLRGGSVVKSS